jgi:ABC-type glycerol-3-phosphate transport system permease component
MVQVPPMRYIGLVAAKIYGHQQVLPPSTIKLLPLLFLYTLVQKYFIAGLLSGAVKG